jgi:hypothetical protein
MKEDEILPTTFGAAIQEMPVFNGGSWPDAQIDVRFQKLDTYVGGYGALMVVSLLYFPLGWLIGLPVGGSCVIDDVTYVAHVGGFQREYHYLADRCAVGGLWYRTAQTGPVLGYTLLALARDLTNDYGEFAAGKLAADPPPISRDVSQEEAWSPRRECGPLPSEKLASN